MNTTNRRTFLKLSASTLIGLTLGGIALRSFAQDKVSPSDEDAKILEYTANSSVNGETCSNCMYATDSAGKDLLKCEAFSGRLVSSSGRCKFWSRAPGK